MIDGKELTALLERLSEFNTYYAKLERRLHDRKLVDTVFEALAGRKGLMQKEGRKLHDVFADESLLGKVEAALAEAGFKTDLISDEEHGLSEIEVKMANNGSRVLIDCTWRRTSNSSAVLSCTNRSFNSASRRSSSPRVIPKPRSNRATICSITF